MKPIHSRHWAPTIVENLIPDDATRVDIQADAGDLVRVTVHYILSAEAWNSIQHTELKTETNNA